MAKEPIRTKAEITQPDDHRGVIVGWTHNDLGSSIDLRIQSAVSKKALEDDCVDSHHFVMTHNQALLLAKYLLDATGQLLPPKAKLPVWRKLMRPRNK